MRYTSALVLSTLAIGQAAASSHNGHASFHKRHEVKRGAEDVNWDGVAYDLSAVDWSKVDYGNGPSGAVSSAAAQAPTSTPAASQPEVAATTPAPASSSPAVQAAEAPSSTQEAAPAESSSSSDPIGDLIGGIAEGILEGIDELVSKLGAKVGLNSEKANGQIWIGDDGDHSITFTNSAEKEALVFCWGKSTMWINANQPLISIKLKAGESQKLAAADGMSGGCGAAYDDSDLWMGLLNESILEFTFGAGANGAHDISREINMKGIVMTSKGKKCTSGMDGGSIACTFVCTDSNAERCGEGGGDYAINVGSAKEGDCMVGKDPFTGDASGGCQMADEGGEHLEVTLQSSRTW